MCGAPGSCRVTVAVRGDTRWSSSHGLLLKDTARDGAPEPWVEPALWVSVETAFINLGITWYLWNDNVEQKSSIQRAPQGHWVGQTDDTPE